MPEQDKSKTGVNNEYQGEKECGEEGGKSNSPVLLGEELQAPAVQDVPEW